VDRRKTFVLWISKEPAGGGATALDGRIEEVDSGRQMRFHSAGQLLSLLEQLLEEK
jgi:hypothetical protein